MWQLAFSDHIVGRSKDIKELISMGLRIVGWERNCFVVSPAGVRWSLVAASLIEGVY